MNFCTIQRRCRNLLLCFRLDARISNILIFMRHFFHQTNKSFYLHSLIFNVVSVKADRKPNKVDSILMPHKQKSREALANARKSIRKRIENKQWTYCSSFVSKTWFYSLVPFFWFFCFLIGNFISFCSPFYYGNWPENSRHHAYSRHHAN